MSRYDDPGWYTNSNNSSQHPTFDDFDHYPFLPTPEDSAEQHKKSAPSPVEAPHRLQRLLGQGIALLALVVIAFWGGWLSNQYFGNSFNQSDKSRAYAQLFQEAWTKIDQNYVDRKAIDYKKMSYAAIDAMVKSLGDSGHTRFMDAQTVQAENQQLSGKFTGIGIYLQQDKNTKQLIITSPIPNSPAAKAGIKHGDIITAVNGVSAAGKDISGVSKLIQGNAGTMVDVTIQRPGEDKTRTFHLLRTEIQVPSVTMHYISDNHTAYIQMTQFADGVANQLKEDVNQAKSMGATRIILDLRDNSGGYLNEAVYTTSLFVKSGYVLQEQDSTGKRTPVSVNGNPLDTTSQMVVLVNKNTASAAEIVAGALKENNRATIIGEQTFGTGTVLLQFPLSDGSALLIGTQEWLTPKGYFIRSTDTRPGGIVPNIPTPLGPKDAIVTPDDANEAHLNEQQLLSSKDDQLIAALHYLQGQK
ncbi:MAG: S41 family peptidase [Ktedonobacteraceae bacterium]